MKIAYRGFNLEARRSKCMAGYALVYYSAYRISDGWGMIDSFADTADTVRTMLKVLKERVDDYHEHPEDYEDEE
ncbi:hypothetical protein KJ885_00665 [Patescibacteria group bacterium]|nr:hypothetical protein [Patescibacteria group bacterium]